MQCPHRSRATAWRVNGFQPEFHDKEMEIDPFDFETDNDEENEDDSTSNRGRFPHEGASTKRAIRKCPFRGCTYKSASNLSRHFLTHGVKNKKTKREYSRKASKRFQSGIRLYKPSMIPKIIRQNWKDLNTRTEFLKFCESLGASLDGKVKKSRDGDFIFDESKENSLSDEENLENEERDSDFAYEDVCSTRDERSTKQKMKDLGFPELPDDHPAIKLLREQRELENSGRTSDGTVKKTNINCVMLPIKRILGYIHMTFSPDCVWELFTKDQIVFELITIYKDQAGLDLSSRKNYLVNFQWALRTVIKRAFKWPDYPADPSKRQTLEDALKSAELSISDAVSNEKKRLDRKTLNDMQEFGENLPKITDWKAYFNDENTKERLDAAIKLLSEASKDDLQSLERNPTQNDVLRGEFNFLSETLGVSQYFVAGSRAGEIKNLTWLELKSASIFEGSLVMKVKNHKTFYKGPAWLEIEFHDLNKFLKYKEILKNFETLKDSDSAFPKLTKEGFKKNSEPTYFLNKWLKKKGLRQFTCNMLRKVIETVAEEFDENTQEAVNKGLNHGKKAANKFYNAPTMAKGLAHKKQVKFVLAVQQFRELLEKNDTDLGVDVREGPVKEEKFKDWVRERFNLEIKDNQQTYQLYHERWMREAVADFVTTSKKIIQNKTATLEKVVKTLKKLPHFKEQQEKIIKLILD